MRSRTLWTEEESLGKGTLKWGHQDES